MNDEIMKKEEATDGPSGRDNEVVSEIMDQGGKVKLIQISPYCMSTDAFYYYGP